AAAEHGLSLDPLAVRDGLAQARWPGRLELVQTRPLVVLDGAHNGDSATRLADALKLHFDFDRLHLVVGVFADKDLGAILRPFRHAATLTAVEAPNPRARAAHDICQRARQLGLSAQAGG